MEDPFPGLDAFDDEPVTSSREDRLRAAFEESKRSFTVDNELIVLQPGWFSNPDRPQTSDKAGLKTTDYDLTAKYLRGEYADTLLLVRAELDITDPTDSKEYFRSILDIGMRCCIKLNHHEEGLRLADMGRDRWAGSPDLALIASKIYVSARRWQDGLQAILAALETRATPKPYIDALLGLFTAWSQDIHDADRTSTALHLSNVVRDRFVVGRQRSFPFLARGESRRPRQPLEHAPLYHDDQVRQWCGIVAADDAEAQRLVAAISSNLSADDAGEGVRRSVREL